MTTAKNAVFTLLLVGGFTFGWGEWKFGGEESI